MRITVPVGTRPEVIKLALVGAIMSVILWPKRNQLDGLVTMDPAVVLLRRNDINMRAASDPIAAIVLHAGVANVDTVIVGGNIVKQNGKLTYGELPRRLAELERSSERLHAGFAPASAA